MKRQELLDYGRFFVVIIVVLFHYTFNGIANGKIDSISYIDSIVNFTKYGYLGVEFFFMISGFVIFHSANNRTPAEFAAARTVRLYPSYWFAVIFTSIFALSWGGGEMSVSPMMIIANLTLLQNYLGFEHVDGVYWTLVYEIQFYALVFLILMFGLQRYLSTFFILWPFIMCVAYISGYDYLPYLGGHFNYFSAGALFAIVQMNKSLKNVFPLFISFVLCLLYSTKKSLLKTESMGVHFSEYIVAAIIFLFFCFFILQITKKAQRLKLPFSKILGALTYPIYLIHAHFGYMFISRYGTEENKIWIYLITIFIVLSVSYFIHKVIEVRFSYMWKALFMNTIYKLIMKIQSMQKSVITVYQRL